MRLVKHGALWVFECSYHEKHIAKTAKFAWHDPSRQRCLNNCAPCGEGLDKAWWTKRVDRALLLIDYADERDRDELNELRERRAKSLEMSRASDADIAIPAPEGLAYRPFQKAGVAYALQRDGCLIADEMGLGKTIQALGVVNADPTIESVLCIVPARLRLNWEREAAKWLTRPFNIRVIHKTDELPEKGDDFVIVNYDKLGLKQCVAMREALLAREWDVLICDESHMLKNAKAKRTKVVLGARGVTGIVTKAKRVLHLTGTPILNRPVEIYPVLASLKPEEFGSFWQFTGRYCGRIRTPYGWDYSGASNLEELQERLRRTVMIRRLKVDVLKELPPKERQVIAIPANGAGNAVEREAEAYRKLKDSLDVLRDMVKMARESGDDEAYRQAIDNLRHGMAVAFTEMARVRHQVALAKLPLVIKHLEAILEEGVQKIVVFAHHRDVTGALHEHFKKKAGAVMLRGGTSGKAGQEAERRFMQDDDCKMFIGSMKAAGQGLTLTASSLVVFAELDWTPAWVSQAEDRCHRITQKNSVLVQHIVLDGSLDSRVAKKLVAKQRILDKALDLAIDATIPVLPFDDEDERDQPPEQPELSNGKSKYPAATKRERASALLALKMLAGVCDGAQRKDGAGFNKLDAHIGAQLANLSYLTDGQVFLSKRILAKYHGQLPKEVCKDLGINCK